MTASTLTQSHLKEILHYDPETGIFTWLVNRGGNRTSGKVAGGIGYDGYHAITVKGVFYRSHRLAWFYMYGEWPEGQIDHINHIRDDNRISNLRDVTHQENQKNKTINGNNTTGTTGVYWHKANRNWTAAISVDKKLIHLGSFPNKQEACCARKAAEKKYGFCSSHGKAIPAN